MSCPLGRFHKGSCLPASCIYPHSCNQNLHRICRQLMLTFLFAAMPGIHPSAAPNVALKTQNLTKVRQRWWCPYQSWQQGRCGRGKPVCIPAHHSASSIRYGFCANSNICRNYMQKYVVLLKLDCNSPKHSEEASDFSYCKLQILKGKQ